MCHTNYLSLMKKNIEYKLKPCTLVDPKEYRQIIKGFEKKKLHSSQNIFLLEHECSEQ